MAVQLLFAATVSAEAIEPQLIHLRSGDVREWSSFPEVCKKSSLEIRWQDSKSDQETTLRLRQQDVKQAWRVRLNDDNLGQLVGDEQDMTVYFVVAPHVLRDGENVLQIEPVDQRAASDDIRVGQIRLVKRPRRAVLAEATIEVRVVDADSKSLLPARITIVDTEGSLQTTAVTSNDELAVRPGVIYTRTGVARFGVPAGEYTIFAGRGCEYSLATANVKVAAGETVNQSLSIAREVPTAGYVACDTHIHTLTFSGHGDATIDERMITLAGEGIELPIATDHNRHIDYEAHARRVGVREYFTPVVGNEVTTAIGHFNVLPIAADARVADHTKKSWAEIYDEIFATPGVKVAILNHARDLHAGTRPFGPALWNAAIGDSIDGWPVRFNAMEVINSGATQTDPLQLARDWMTLLNRGYDVTPIGSSDSHDVERFIVGQGRTYIRCDDRDVSKIDVDAAVDSLLAGRVVVSYGLFAELTIDSKFQPGDLAVGDADEVLAEIKVLGPAWVEADLVELYANGQLLREAVIDATASRDLPRGVKWQGTFRFTRPSHDVHFVAIASGPGVMSPHWPMAKPYQSLSPEWKPRSLGISGPVWVDADRDARRTSSRAYGERLVAAEGTAVKTLTAKLAQYDVAVTAQAAHAYRLAHETTWEKDITTAMQSAEPHVAAGFRAYIEAWQASERARAER